MGVSPSAAKVVADMLQAVGVNRIILTDIHAPAMQGFFNIPMETLSAVPLIIDYLKQQDLSDSVIVAPDVGRAKLAEQYAERLGVPLALIHKARESATTSRIVGMIGDLKGKSPVIIDDIISTGGTIVEDCLRRIKCRCTTAVALSGSTRSLGGFRPGPTKSGLHSRGNSHRHCAHSSREADAQYDHPFRGATLCRGNTPRPQ